MKRVGVIGLGQIAWAVDEDPQRQGIWSHVGAYCASPHTEIVAVSSRNAEVCQVVQDKFAIPNAYNDYRAMLSGESLDIVSVCTPIATHYDIVMACVEVGVKAIFCEKTLAYDLAEAHAMVGACQDRGIVLAVNYPRRWDGRTQHVQALLADNAIGTMRTIVGYGATALHTSTSHLIDLMCLFAGPPNWVVGEGATDFVRNVHGIDDPGGIGMIGFDNGVVGFVKGDSQSPQHYMSELDLIGTDGRIRLTDDGAHCHLYQFAESRESPGSGIQVLLPTDAGLPIENERTVDAIADIVSCLDSAEEPVSSGRSSLQSLAIVEAIKESAANDNIKIRL